ncbi:MAG: hypothetical protein ACYCWW_06330 [Deltaproteobacteria bacterium]
MRYSLLFALVLAACGGQSGLTDGGSDGGGPTDGGQGCDAGGFAVCACTVEPTFASINANVLQPSCGGPSVPAGACHTSGGALNSGGLDLADDPYHALLGADGGGALAENIAGSATGLRRVVPGQPDASFLVIKLSTMSRQDPNYGSGMPFTAPGSVCPATLDAIRSWVANGAPND